MVFTPVSVTPCNYIEHFIRTRDIIVSRQKMFHGKLKNLCSFYDACEICRKSDVYMYILKNETACMYILSNVLWNTEKSSFYMHACNWDQYGGVSKCEA